MFDRGLLRTFQIPHEFASLSVRDNLMMVPSGQIGESLSNVWLRRSAIDQQEFRNAERADSVMQFLTLSHLAHVPAGHLSAGQKKLLELGRTMMVDAHIVLLDEISAGVNRTLLGFLGDAIVRLNKEHNYTFCMIEHDFTFLSKICDSIIVLAEGQVLTSGDPASIRKDARVIEAYLGKTVDKEEKFKGGFRTDDCSTRH